MADRAAGLRSLFARRRPSPMMVASDRASAPRGTYAEIQSLTRHRGIDRFGIVVPRGAGEAPTGVAFANPPHAARRFLDVELTDGGPVPPPFTAREPVPLAASPSMFPSNDEVPHAAAVA